MFTRRQVKSAQNKIASMKLKHKKTGSDVSITLGNSTYVYHGDKSDPNTGERYEQWTKDGDIVVTEGDILSAFLEEN